MNIPEAENTLEKPLVGKFKEKLEARRNPLGKIYYIYVFCALVFTDPV